MSHACRKLVAYGKSALRGQISINRAKIVRKGLGTERLSETSRIPEAKRESPSNYILCERMHDGKPTFLPGASSKTCHTFPKRVFLKLAMQVG